MFRAGIERLETNIIENGECCVKQARQEFFNHKNIYHSVVKRNSYIDNDFKDLMDRECGVVWKARKEDNRKKTDWLLQKWRNKNDDAESNIRGVKYRDVDLNGSESDKNPEPVKKMILKSGIKIEGVNKWELVKFVAVTVPPEEIVENKLEGVVPTRAKTATRKLTLNCLKSDKDDGEKWIPAASDPDEDQTRALVALALSHCVEVVMKNHTYKLGDKTFLQSDGGPIGLELTGAVSRAFMMMWDELYLRAVEDEGLVMLLYYRYVDDSNQIVLDDSGSDDGEEIALKLKNIANSVMEGIEVEVDLPSRHSDGKMPILDMKVHINNEGFVVYEHYEKPVTTKLVISERSAHSANCKRSVHVSELIRRMTNTSRRLDWNKSVVPVLEDYLQRMKTAGYNERYRKSVLENANTNTEILNSKAEMVQPPIVRLRREVGMGV